jgi:pimeloyl-ACP methyl ester carboxylesterase
VWTPTLTGLGDRIHLRGADGGISLALHARDVVAAMTSEDLSDIILVGHSYGGMVVTQAAAQCQERIAGVVYLDAFVPVAGRTLFDLITPQERDGLRALAAAQPDPTLLPPFPPAGYGVTEPVLSTWLAARLHPMPIACFEDAAEFDADVIARLPRAYVFATASERDRFSGFAAQFRGGGHGYYEVPSGHDMMLTHVDETADILDRESRRLREAH